jgi:hypothetical protein
MFQCLHQLASVAERSVSYCIAALVIRVSHFRGVQVEQGADLLDINMDDGLIEGVGAMTRFVNLLVADPETSRVPFMIDSSKVMLQPLLICDFEFLPFTYKTLPLLA